MADFFSAFSGFMIFTKDTETNSEEKKTENGWVGKCVVFWDCLFSGAILVFVRVFHCRVS